MAVAQASTRVDRLPWRAAAERASARLAGRARGMRLTDDAGQAESDRARASEMDDFAARFARHDADVLRVCRRILGSREAAEDARGEVFLRARRGFASFEEGRPFRPWLLAIAGNWCIDQLRRRAFEQRTFSDSPEEETLPSAGPSPLSRAMARQRGERLGTAIEQLPLRYRLPIVLRYFADEDYESIASALGVSRNQVGSLIFRAKRMLRGKLADDAGEEGTS